MFLRGADLYSSDTFVPLRNERNFWRRSAGSPDTTPALRTPVTFSDCTFISKTEEITIVDTTASPTPVSLFGVRINRCEFDADSGFFAAGTDHALDKLIG